MASLHNVLPTNDYGPVATDIRTRSLLNSYRRSSTRCHFLLAISLILASVALFDVFPSLYDDIREFEQRFPQHDPSLAESVGTKYLAFPDHIWGHGWNNILQEYVMHSYLAYITNRSFVFDDYIWSHGPFPYTVYDLEFRVTRVPLNAFISGPIAGAPFFAPANSFPRAVHAKFWEAICPRERRHTILSADVPGDVWGTSRIQWWRDEIAKKENVFCLEVRQKPIFNFSFFGGPELLDIWPSLSQAPILTQLRWSPLISAAIERNFVILSDPHEHLRTIQANPDAAINELASASQAVLPVGMYPSLVAVHIRRGDFIRHCPRLASWGSPFHGFNSFKGLPDPWITSRDSSQLDTVEYYRKRCLPSQDEIVERLHAIRNEYDAFLSNQTNTTRFILDAQGSPTVAHKLRRVFILSNARILWLDGLKDKLVKDGWENVISRRDLVLDKQQRGVSVAVDMSVAEKAEMFVGNGFSSFSGNIVMLRTAKGFQTQTNRFF